MDKDDPETDGRLISREGLLHTLQRVAAVRAIITMLFVPVFFVAITVVDEALGKGRMVVMEAIGNGAIAVLLFGGVFVVSALMTQFYCKPAVRCPHCGRSLWHCGTGNFKPRRMKIRKDANECPGCHARLV